MKPEKLIICGWGPYKEEAVIDFKKLNTSGLFLITGQTGAGKTTIFDAIAYALYGVLSGDVREKGSVRSDFSDANTKTYVELYMIHRGERYHISRNPEYQRPKKRKSGENAFTKEKENAVLTMPDGAIIAGNQDVTAKMEELLHMDGRQFRQISMIAQGEFAKMLFATSAEKNGIFRELFGTGIYAGVQMQLKNDSANLYREYMILKNKMEEDVHLLTLEDEQWTTLTEQESLDFEAVEKYLKKKMQEESCIVTKHKEVEKQLEEELLAMQKEMEAAEQLNKRFKELEATQKKLNDLEAKHTQINQIHMQIQAARNAGVLYLEEKVVQEKEQSMTEMSVRVDNTMTEVSNLKKENEKMAETANMKNKILEAYSVEEQLREMQKQALQYEKNREQAQKELQAARNLFENAQKQAEEKRKQYDEADTRYKKAVIGIAAKLVEEGKPCPVCGSLEHPDIAHISEDIPDERQLELWKKEAEESKARADQCYEKARNLINEEKRYADSYEECAEQIKRLEEVFFSFDAEICNYVKAHNREEFEKRMECYLENSTRVAEKEKQLLDAKAELEKKSNEVKEARSNLDKKIAEHGFADRREYENAVSFISIMEEKEKEYRDYQDALTGTKKLYEHLQNALAGLLPIETDPVKERFEQKKQEKKECRELVEQCNIRMSQITRALQGIQKNRVQSEKIKKEYGIVKELDDLANGNNARRLVFEQFVLAGYFERILKAANIRLGNMTDGRYELQRASQVSDGRKKDNLEILVMDYYTGRKRSVKTLSGGETFKASLALALGMSDCIQAENGGMEVETLFIDEGFGALDEESLEQACSTLQRLAGKNRMVGIISHVAQLRERIEHQIVVEKKNNGSYVNVV